MINGIEKGILAIFCRYSSWNHLPETLQDSDAGNVVLFQIKVSGRSIKETMLAKYCIKVTALLSFTRLSVIRQINRVH